MNDCRIQHGLFDATADGSIRAFCQGVIAQHGTKSLDRILGRDFRFATDEELDVLEAFQRWLGRRPLTEKENAIQGTTNATELHLTLLQFKDLRVAKGIAHYRAMTVGSRRLVAKATRKIERFERIKESIRKMRESIPVQTSP